MTKLIAAILLIAGCGKSDGKPSSAGMPSAQLPSSSTADMFDPSKPLTTEAMIAAYIAICNDPNSPLDKRPDPKRAGYSHERGDKAEIEAYLKQRGFSSNNQYRGFLLHLASIETEWFVESAKGGPVHTKLALEDRKLFEAHRAEIEAADKVQKQRDMANNR